MGAGTGTVLAMFGASEGLLLAGNATVEVWSCESKAATELVAVVEGGGGVVTVGVVDCATVSCHACEDLSWSRRALTPAGSCVDWGSAFKKELVDR